MHKYPIGLQDFDKLIKGGFVYIDKTKYLYNLLNDAGVYFLSRPRRFGKSLLISTIDELFKGNKELFKNTFIYDKWDWTQKNPIIRLSFTNIGEKTLGLSNAINKALDEIANKYDITTVEASFDQKFKDLIQSLDKKYGKVVILIDEYDKPIIDYLADDEEKAELNRALLKNFYSVLKDADSHIRMLFITGVSKFSKVSIFSDLNHLKDISIHSNYGGICGITEEELSDYFKEELEEFNVNEIREWYNGYTWDRKTKVYNPFSLLNYFDAKEFHNFWYQSGHPAFLWKLLKNVNVYDLENIEADLMELDSYDIQRLDFKVLLYQTGYITFGEELSQNYYKMRFPNKEVEHSFNSFLWTNYSEHKVLGPTNVLLKLKNAFKANDFVAIKEQLNTLFASLPYDFMAKEKEVVFHAIIHLTFSLLGEFVLSEVHTHKGRCDALVINDDSIFCFEFKLGKTAHEALEQIKEKRYLDAFKNQNKKLFAIGVNYSKENKEIDDFVVEEN